MKNKLVVIGVLLVLSALVYASSNRLTWNFVRENYQEECIEYEAIPYNVSVPFCNSTTRWAMLCDTPLCDCPNIDYQIEKRFNKTDECLKYTLVRYEKKREVRYEPVQER